LATSSPHTESVPAEYLEGTGYSRRRKAAQAANGWWIKLMSKLQRVGAEHIPPYGPLLHVSNHLHNTDPILHYYAFPRPLHFMGKKELFKFPVIRHIAELSGGFPVDRGKVDREALRNAEDRLRRGIPLGMYPEGGRSPTGALIEGKSGAGLLALKTGAPILPVAITGSERLPFNGAKGRAQHQQAPKDPGHKGVRIVYGQPFHVPREFDGQKVSATEATEIIMLEIARLLPEDYRGVYTDRLKNQSVRKIIPYDFKSSSSSGSSAPSDSSSLNSSSTSGP
jgi:1-acyl-sn-glycerol-3-phosphate acyltransferase